MIDTVVLRIHRIREKYNHLVKYLKQVNTDNYVKKFSHHGLEAPVKTAILFGDTGRILDIKLSTHIHVPSSHYDVYISVNSERDFIEINFSLPKYIHSTNVLQFVDPHDQTLKHTFEKFQGEISRFFNEYFPISPDWLDVEINRIDFCFNQFFLSKGDALRYLDEQNKLNVNYARSDTNRFQQYGGTTVMYKTANYSFKIYHKGTEFRKNDYSRLCKSNPKNIDLEHIRDTSDKILRYELTAHNKLLNYLFKQRVKDNEYTMFNIHYARIGKHRTKASRQFLDDVQNKSFRFHLDSDWERQEYNDAELMQNKELPFNYELFEEIYNFFWERVNKYQLGVKLGIVDIYEKIKTYQAEKEINNKLNGKKDNISDTASMLLIATLSQYCDVTDLKKVLPKSTYYRYRNKLKELGVKEYSPDIAVRPPELDYISYFYEFGRYHHVFNYFTTPIKLPEIEM